MNISIFSSSTTASEEMNVLIIGGRMMFFCTYCTLLIYSRSEDGNNDKDFYNYFHGYIYDDDDVM